MLSAGPQTKKVQWFPGKWAQPYMQMHIFQNAVYDKCMIQFPQEENHISFEVCQGGRQSATVAKSLNN